MQATERSGTTRGVQQSGAGRAACYWPAGSPPRGFRGEPAVSRSEGPCGPSERDVGARAEAGGSAAARRRPAAFVLAAVEALAAADGRSGVPAGLIYGGPRERAVLGCRRGSYRSAASCATLRAHAAAGGVALHRTERRRSGGGSRASDRSESAESWRETCRLDH